CGGSLCASWPFHLVLRLGGPRSPNVDPMPARRVEAEHCQHVSGDLTRGALRESERPEAVGAQPGEQHIQTGAAILDERWKRHNLHAPVLSTHVEDAGLDSLVGGDGESPDLVLPCSEGLDRPLPAHVLIRLEQVVCGKIIDRDRDYETAPVLISLGVGSWIL